jgi:hypothetical protein
VTKRDLIDAYVRGDVDRRGFIRKLSAMGVSAAAATAYAGSFGQDAAAAPRTSAGYVSRLQDADADYGIAVAIRNIIEALQKFLARRAALIQRLEQVISQGNGPRPEVLQKVRDQIAEQRDALVARLQQKLGQTGQASTVINSLTANRVQGDATLADIANDLNVQTGLLAAIIPAIEDGQDRQLMTNIGLVTARHAALINDLAGLDPIPSAFEVPIDPATVS